MKEIIELNKRLLGQLGMCLPDGGLVLGRNDQPEELAALPAALREEIEKLRREINEVVPNDFTYSLDLGNDSPGLMIEYEDGSQTGFFRGHDWRSDRSIIEQLREFNWDAERVQALAGCQIFDGMKDNAKHLPSRLPWTKELQKAFRVEMKEFLKAKRKDLRGVYVLMWRDDEGMKVESFEDQASFCRELPDIMTVQYLVIAVVADGKPMSREGLEILKKKAITELEDMPISHARALGKF
jgi:hypothetical protein